MRMKTVAVSLCFLVLGFTGSSLPAHESCTESYGTGKNSFSLATGSPGELGLLKVLGETFGKTADATLCWVKAGSGESLKLLKEKKST